MFFLTRRVPRAPAEPAKVEHDPTFGNAILQAYYAGKKWQCMCGAANDEHLRKHLNEPYPAQEDTEYRSDDIEYAVNFLEHISLCEDCLRNEPEQWRLHTLAHGTVKRYRDFYLSLYQLLFSKGCKETFEVEEDFACEHDERVEADHWCLFAMIQVERIITSVSRIVAIVGSVEPHMDHDSWYIVLNLAERLMEATNKLQYRVKHICRT
ncbi:uncharacterized protein BO97DRAFT_414514 [Aspergillus homomorphus CBS 101889]|uniref:Uncharacterized protein n=1 Tax=Aspergillus homomorphus (strain CBS 101889) TaxID=1450537 RepID=A0A395HWN7_ASPHC|nr:hypothetical protein BO97DRAFT_414514 [Aspergillus homomorphus CBS 101889]RAL12332.1 hypothetical protein BO97DRAFT_414514 [Aspergillus homomorphus CBS 101889]